MNPPVVDLDRLRKTVNVIKMLKINKELYIICIQLVGRCDGKYDSHLNSK